MVSQPYEVIKREINTLFLRKIKTDQYYKIDNYKKKNSLFNLGSSVEKPFFGYFPYDSLPDAVIFGIPYKGGTRSSHSKVDQFPNILRESSYKLLSRNSYPLSKPLKFYDLSMEEYLYCGSVLDIGNVRSDGSSSERLKLRSLCDFLSQISIPFICVGGDHSYTYDVISAFKAINRPITIWQFDAHLDMLSTSSNILDHGNVFEHVLDLPFVQRIIQVGGRGLRTPHQITSNPKVIRIPKSKVSSLLIREYAQENKQNLNYISIDLDCLDPSVFPFVDFAVPLGLTFEQLVSCISELLSTNIPIIGADIVEGTAGGSIIRGDYDIPMYILISMLSGLASQNSLS